MRLIQRCTCRRWVKAGELCQCGKRPPKNYTIEYRYQGRILRETVGPKDLALVRMGEIRRSILEKRYLNINKNADTSLGALIDWYIALPEVMMLRSYSERVRALKEAGASIGLQLPLTADFPPAVQRYRTARLRHCTPATVNRDISYLKACLNKCVQYQMLENNPIDKMPLLPEDNHRDVGLSEDEVLRLASNCPGWLGEIVTVAFYTMMRRGEILGLRKTEVDWKNDLINLPGSRTKNGKSRVLPIPTQIKSLLQSKRFNMALETIFSAGTTYSLSYIQKCFSEAAKRSGFNDLHFHDLRHSGAQFWHENGTPIETLMEVGGWSNFDMLKRYLFNRNKPKELKKVCG